MIIAVSSYVAERYGKEIRAIARNARLVHPEGDGWSGDAGRAEVAYFSEDFWTAAAGGSAVVRLFALADLRWFHSFAAGVDHPAFGALLERGVILTNSSGTTSAPIAQYVLAMMLRAVKPLDAWAASQREQRWANIPSDELTGKTAGIVGIGHIGGEVARLAKAFGMQTLGCRRRPGRVRHVDEIVPPERLHDLLSRSDFVVLAVPLSAATERLIGRDELRAMQPHAWLINISRGRVVHEGALIRALEKSRIAGACLDVVEHEPLAPDSALWSMPNVIITPHNSGRSPLNAERGAQIFLDNLRRYVAGKPLRNRVRKRDL